MSAAEEKEIFRKILLDKPSWKGLEGSELEDIMTTYVGQRIDAIRYEIQSGRRETFLRLARKRESVIFRAESEGYIPKLPTPFELNIEVENKGAARVYPPYRLELISPDQTGIVLAENDWIEPGAKTTFKGQQLSREVKTFVSSASADVFQKFLVGGPDENGAFTINSFSVTVNGDPWTNVQSFRNGGPGAFFYHVFYEGGDELSFMFGDGEVGKIPDLESEVEVEIWRTLADNFFLQPGQNLVLLETDPPLLDEDKNEPSLKFVSGSFLRQGQPLEPLEIIRQSTLAHIQGGEMAARNVDYEHRIQSRFPELMYLKIWGEKEQTDETGHDLSNINKAFFTFLLKKEKDEEQAAYDLRVTATRAAIIEYWEKQIKPMNIDPDPVPLLELPFQITIKGEIDRGVELSTVQSEINKLLLAIFGRYSTKEDFVTIYNDYDNSDALLELYANYGERSGKIQESDFHDVIKSTGYFDNRFKQSRRRDRPGFEVILSGNLSADFFDKYVYLEEVIFQDWEGQPGLGYVDNI